jgi:hypothetical protein
MVSKIGKLNRRLVRDVGVGARSMAEESQGEVDGGGEVNGGGVNGRQACGQARERREDKAVNFLFP